MGTGNPKGPETDKPAIYRYRASPRLYVRREKAALYQWVQVPPGAMLQPEATGAIVEVTKRLKPSVKLSRNTVTVRMCRP